MHSNSLPDNSAWIARFKTLRDWVAANGRLPEPDLAGGPEDTLCTWLERQRTAAWEGSLDAGLAAVLATIRGAAPDRRTPAIPDRLTALEDFYREHGRLPAYSGKDPIEAKLYQYLNGVVRVRHRRGQLKPDTVERLKLIPGVFEPRVLTRANAGAAAIAQDPRTAELVSFCQQAGHAPRSRGTATEVRLNAFMRRTIRPAAEDGRLDEVTLLRLSKVQGVLAPAVAARAA